MGDILSLLTELAESPAVGDLMVWTDVSDTTQAASGTTKRNEARFGVGTQVNAQTGTTYTYLTTDFRKLVTHTNAAAIAGTLPQAGASFPAGWYMLVQNRGAGALTITPTTSTIDGAATLVLNQNEGAIVTSDGTNYFTLRGKATGAAGVGDVVGPGSATDLAVARYDGATGKLIQDSDVTIDDDGAITVPEIAAPATPAAGKVSVYAKADGKLYIKDDAGTETDLTDTGAGGAEAGANSDITSMDALAGALETPTRIDFAEGAAPSAPGANKVSLYAKADGLLYSKDDAGTETVVSGGAGGGGSPGGASGNIQANDGAGGFTGSNAANLAATPSAGNAIVTVVPNGTDRYGLKIGNAGGDSQVHLRCQMNNGGTRFLDIVGDSGIVTQMGLKITSGTFGIYDATNSVRVLNYDDLRIAIDAKRDGLGGPLFTFNGIGASTQGIAEYFNFSRTGSVWGYLKRSGFVMPSNNMFTTAQFDKTDTTLADVTGLSYSLIDDSKTFKFEADLQITADATGGIKVGVISTASVTSCVYSIEVFDTSNTLVKSGRSTDLSTSFTYAGSTSLHVRIVGSVAINAASGGSIKIQFAQSSASGTSSVLRGSLFTVTPLN